MQRSVASGYRLAMEVSYFYQGVSADHPYAGGAFLAVNVSILDRWYGFAGYLLTDRIENEAHGVQLDLERSPFLLGTGFCFALKRTCLGGLFALGLEIIEEQVRTSTSHLEPVESNTELGLSLMPAIRLDVKIIGPLSIYALAGARIELNRYRYTVNDGVDHKVIFEAWPVQPVGMAGVTTALF